MFVFFDIGDTLVDESEFARLRHASVFRALAHRGIAASQEQFESDLNNLSMRGRMVVMAGRDAKPSFPVGPFYVKDCSLHGFATFNSTAEEQEAAAKDISQWMAEGKLKARIDRILPLSKAAEAHRLQEESTIHKSGALSGKIILKP